MMGTDIKRAAAVLRAGGLVAFPTETVYGLGADASSAEAVGRIFDAKGRPRGHPLIVHLAAGADLDEWAIDIPETARRLAAAAWPGPLTLILAKSDRVASATTGGSSTVGLRVPAHPVAQALLAAFGGGVAAPSANRFGAVSPTTAAHVAADLGERVDYLLDGGPCSVGVESTIVDLSRGRPVLLRPGGLARAAIEAITGPLGEADAAAPAAPGTLASHYAPQARVIAVSLAEVPAVVAAQPPTTRVAVLAPASAFAAWRLDASAHAGASLHPSAPPFGGASAHAGASLDRAHAHALPDDPAGMARELYAALRDLDALGVDVVVAALPPSAGLGEAVSDRLRRAAGPRDH